jgi:hypothetical protein
MNKKRMVLPFMEILLASALLAGCASTRQTVAVATGPIASNDARIVISRPNQIIGCAAGIAIVDNRTHIGDIGPGGQLVWDRTAGPMELTAVNTFSTPEAIRGKPLKIGVGGGQNYQFDVSFPSFGSSWVPELELVSGTPVPYERNEENASGITKKGEAVLPASAKFSESLSVPVITVKGIGGMFKFIEVQRFTQADGLNLSQAFVDSFANGLREGLTKKQLADQVVGEGGRVTDADAVNSAVVEGKFIEYKEGGFLAGIGTICSEISLFRKSDHALIATIKPRTPFKPSPLNTDTGVGKHTGQRTAYEIEKALK